MPDSDWWTSSPRDDLEGLERDVPHLEAEVRRLRFALRRIADESARPRSWEELRAALETVRAVADAALTRSVGPVKR